MGTFFNISVATSKSEAAVDIGCDAAFEEVNRIEAMMTTHRGSSALSEVNRAAGKAPVAVPRELFELLERALRISRTTAGKFDITFGPVGALWRFRGSAGLPDVSELKRRLPLLDYRKVVLDAGDRTVFLAEAGMSLGLGAIAKGYAVDRAAAVLSGHGLTDFIIYGGGDISVSGTKGGKPWRVGIQDPRNRSRYFADFPLEKGAVVTSGDYEKFFILEGRRYHHIIDPDTGYPANSSVSVTIITESAADADALATGIFVLGPEEGMRLIESRPNLEGVIVDTTLKPWVSSGLKPKIALTPITREVRE